MFKKILKVNVQTESEPSQSESQGFFSQPKSSQNTQRPTSSQSRPRSRTNSLSRKSQLQKYNESKPLSCLDANPFSVIRFRIPSIHKPGSINSNGYHGIICYRSVESYDSSDPSKFKLRGNIPVTDLDKQDYYFSNVILAHWCSCKSGMRTIGSCTHIISALVGFGRPAHYSKPRFRVLNTSTFHSLI